MHRAYYRRMSPHPSLGGLGHCRRRIPRPTRCSRGHYYRRLIPRPNRRDRDHWHVRDVPVSQCPDATSRWHLRHGSCLTEQEARTHTLHVLLRCVRDFDGAGLRASSSALNTTDTTADAGGLQLNIVPI
jgi:hypothetical protein